ncbi:cystatin cpi-1-like [Hydra vulgaris]|uniref:Cystatin cpi-1-like n=1 Tax=Hydra vulgaris TaxID=6087 RepID=A0ABM4BGK4_HYDVU
MNSVFVFIALIGLSFGLPGDKVELSNNQIKGLLSENGAFSTGLNVAIGKLNDGNGEFRTVRDEVLGATSQVVAGIRYEVDVKVVDSVCANLEINANKMTTNECPAKEQSEAKTCKVTIWSRPWLQTAESLIVNIVC